MYNAIHNTGCFRGDSKVTTSGLHWAGDRATRNASLCNPAFFISYHHGGVGLVLFYVEERARRTRIQGEHPDHQRLVHLLRH